MSEAAIAPGPHTSRWFEMTRARIAAFAEATEDRQAIHLDDAASPHGVAIAHGLLTLSMLSAMAYDAVPVTGTRMGINYGFDRVRFVRPVPAGARVRGHLTLLSAEPKDDMTALTWEVSMEIEGEEKPALVARWLSRIA